jgi:hypothetical protein
LLSVVTNYHVVSKFVLNKGGSQVSMAAPAAVAAAAAAAAATAAAVVVAAAALSQLVHLGIMSTTTAADWAVKAVKYHL